jgi:glycosyltransferase involved in cell wall biosynthesis
MKVAFITRSTLYTTRGGDTVQVMQTAKQLAELSIEVDIKLTHEKINYEEYDLLHFFNLVRPADILHHIYKTDRPFVLSPILVNYAEYDLHERKGISGAILKMLSPSGIEYAKTTARWLKGSDKLVSKSYLWKGQKKSMQEILNRVSMVLSNADLEQEQLMKSFTINKPFVKVPAGIEPALFHHDQNIEKDPLLVLCVARIEGIKNQLNLIKAVNNTPYRLLLIGASSPNQQEYYKACKKIAGDNISFIDHLPQEQLLAYYQQAKVHVLPSWWEVCGLSSLEAVAMGCQAVITNRGYTKEYFEDMAYYCDPGSPESIRLAIEEAAHDKISPALQQKVLKQYTWQAAATKIAAAYKTVLAAL